MPSAARGPGAGRASWYTGLVGLAVGAMVTGLLVPFVQGERETTAAAVGFEDTGDGPAAGPAGPGLVDTGEATGPAEDEVVTQPEAPLGADPAPLTGPSGSASPTPTRSATEPDPGAVRPSRAPLRATDQGVTAEAIKVAFLLLDLGQTGRVGVSTTGVDPRQQQAAIEAYVADINERGGIHGRRIDPFFRVFDVTSPDDQRAACAAATEDAKAFAVVAMPGFGNDAVLCVTEQHRTPLVVTGQALSREFFTRSQGRLISLASAGDRMMRNWVVELDRIGALKGRTIGIVASANKNSKDTADDVLVPALEAAGHRVGHVTYLAPDQATAASQAPAEIQRMRAAGVDAVLLLQGFLYTTPFVQTADRQGWRPRWLQSEFTGGTSDFEVQAMPASFDGALAMTSQRFGEWREDVPEPAGDARCRELYERRSGERLPRNNGAQSNASYPTILFACGMLRVFESAATAAGPELTRARLVGVVQGGLQAEGAFYFPGAFRQGKTDLSDMVRFNRYVHDCRCWRNVDAPRPARFR